ncbi:ribosomal RNA-processing protein 7 homolog A-like [Sycon ciliatum]|uniref:ribosomal RNA-processing protein 7 homolog A-like n=1 Tax=Sycon ciliatum TaxID=27933 RepID=UPI0020AAD795|eukprot:scpid81072/ scgid17038/ Ribosomal RNA-processing protein 7 homolog A; Gastric cancer antigen Zg14 homolog
MDIGGFRTVRVKFDETCQSSHCVYIKKHNVRIESDATPPDRTLFVLNVPPFCDEDSVRHIFERFGPISAVHLRSKPGNVTTAEERTEEEDYFRPPATSPGFRCGYVVFEDGQHLSTAVKDKYKDVVVLSTEARPLASGITKWCQDYRQRWPDPALLHRSASAYIETYEARVAQEKTKAERAAGRPDEEGWIEVTRGSKKSVATTTLAKTRQLTPKERRRLRKEQKDKELLHFYQFQHREKKREQIAQLRRKFEEDKEKIKEMRSARKFRPF